MTGHLFFKLGVNADLKKAVNAKRKANAKEKAGSVLLQLLSTTIAWQKYAVNRA